MTFWPETWDGGGGAPWPPGWSTAGTPGASTATVESGTGRLTAGPGAYTAARARLDRMTDQRDVNIVVTFTPATTADWYLTIGARTQNNDPPFDNNAFTSRGMYVQLYNFFGAGVLLRRWDDSGWFTDIGQTTAGLPLLTPGTAYTVRFRVDGRRLRFRVWAAASPEPATWALDVTDPDAYLPAGKVTIAFQTSGGGDTQHASLDNLAVYGLDAVRPSGPTSPTPHEWTMWSRDGDYAPDVVLPIAAVKIVKRHVGIGGAVAETEFTPERWESLQPSRGLVLFRDGRQEFTGKVTAREQVWDVDNGQLRIQVEAASDELDLADRLVFPDPLRAADDQTVNDYWTFTGAASTAMRQLISDQAGPTCRADRRVPGLVLGADPGVGLSRTWTGLFTSAGDNGVLDQLAAISIASGENLGLRVTSAAGALTFDIVEPRDLADAIRFSADLGDLVGYKYREEAPTCTDAVTAGQGDLRLRLRKHVTTASTLALAWGRRIFKYIDRRDTADVAELTKEATDAVVEGDAKVSLAVTLTDSQAATYGRDWDLGDRITVYVAPPGQDTTISVTDVVREIVLEVDANGVESITPAVGTWDATALPASPSQQQLASVGTSLAGLIARK